jgi:hypothetical protein
MRRTNSVASSSVHRWVRPLIDFATRPLWHDGDTMGTTSQVLLLPDANLGIVVLANRAVGQPFYHAVQRFSAETALSREHAPDTDDLAANAEVLDTVHVLAGSASAVPREQAEPYLGDYGHGVRVGFSEQGLMLTTAFGDTPLVSRGEPGVFSCGGVITAACFSAAFDLSAQPAQLQLDLFLNPAQPFTVERN